MSTMEAEVFEAFRTLGVSDEKASAAAQALNRRSPEVASLANDVAVLKLDVASINVKLAVVQAVLLLVAAGVSSLVIKAFVHL
jgi:hypothetical protein